MQRFGSLEQRLLSAKSTSKRGLIGLVENQRNLQSAKRITNSGGFLVLNKKKKKGDVQGNLTIDKETLYEENLSIKMEFNKLVDENRKLKTDILLLERQIEKYENIIEERKVKKKLKAAKLEIQTAQQPLFQSTLETPTNDQKFGEVKFYFQKNVKNALIITQKRQIKELQKEIQDKDKTIDQYKHDIRLSRLQEIQIELRQYQDECLRLKTVLTSKLKQEEILKDKSNTDKISETFKRDNIILSTMMAKLEQDYNHLKVRQKEFEQEIHKEKAKRIILERQIFEKDKEIFKLRTDQSNPSKKISKEQEKEFKEIIESKNSDIFQLQIQIDSYKNQLASSDKRSKELQQELQQSIVLEQKEKLIFSRQTSDLKRQMELMMQQLQKYKQIAEGSGDEESQDLGSAIIQRSPKKLTKIIKQQKKKVAKVNFYNVEELGQEIRLKLWTQGIKYEDVESYMTFDFEAENVSILQLVQIFKKPPFSLENSKDALLIARYLVEDNQEERVYFDENQTNQIKIVKSVFKNLVKPYQLFTEMENTQLYKDLSKNFTKFKDHMVDAIKQILIKKKDIPPEHCDYEDLESAFRYCDLTLTPKQYEYLALTIYTQNRTVNRLNYVKLIKYFECGDQ